MRDIAVLLFLVACISLIIRVPWTGVLVMAVFSYLSPHRYAWGFMSEFPVYLIAFLGFLFVFLIKGHKDRQPLPRDWRIPAFFMLWAWFLVTTIDALSPSAWVKLEEVSKIYLPLIFTLWLINSRKKLLYLNIAIAVSFGLIAVKGGVWAIGTGFGNRVYGPERTMYGGNNEIAVAILMAIPLLILWFRETSDKRIRLALTAAIPLCFAAVVSTHSRGALVTLGILIPLLLWHSKRKWLAVPVLALAVYAAPQFLPEHWFARMATIETYEEDASAMGRLTAWRDGIAYAFSNPLTGAGFNGWLRVTERDWHSSYVEALAEHGFVGFSLWLSLIFGTILSLTRLPRLTRHIPEMEWVANYSYMLRASLLAYATGALFLGITYWDFLYQLIFMAVLVKKFALEELAAYEGKNAIGNGTKTANAARSLHPATN
jgi:probable O-glycosylation ligase (exosortase A-associated)